MSVARYHWSIVVLLVCVPSCELGTRSSEHVTRNRLRRQRGLKIRLCFLDQLFCRALLMEQWILELIPEGLVPVALLGDDPERARVGERLDDHRGRVLL